MLGGRWSGRHIIAFATAVLACSGATVRAREGNTQAGVYYGRGVHAMHRGQYAEALAQFDMATGYDSDDPRIFFWRGIAKSRLGMRDDARVDFQIGAQLEVQQGRHDVGSALQRIQGGERLALEE